MDAARRPGRRSGAGPCAVADGLLLLLALASPAAAPPAAHLQLRFAAVLEQAPADPEDAANRGVTLRLEVGGAPDCPSSAGSVSYDFLIDADLEAATGSSDRRSRRWAWTRAWGPSAIRRACCSSARSAPSA